MSEDYYETIGRILNNSFSQNKDPFDAIKKDMHGEKDGQSSQFSQKEDNRKRSFQSTRGADTPKENITKAEFQKMKIPKIAVPQYLIEDFLTLRLPPGSSLAECKASWKDLLKRYHPDLQDSNNSNDAQVIIRINSSFKRIEKWFASIKG